MAKIYASREPIEALSIVVNRILVGTLCNTEFLIAVLYPTFDPD
jgi:hypothetical protein